MRGYYDFDHSADTPPLGTRVQVPAGFAVFADSYRPDALRTPHQLAEHFFDIARWTEMPRGGHFAALEAPELLADEIREFFARCAERRPDPHLGFAAGSPAKPEGPRGLDRDFDTCGALVKSMVRAQPASAGNIWQLARQLPRRDRS